MPVPSPKSQKCDVAFVEVFVKVTVLPFIVYELLATGTGSIASVVVSPSKQEPVETVTVYCPAFNGEKFVMVILSAAEVKPEPIRFIAQVAIQLRCS